MPRRAPWRSRRVFLLQGVASVAGLALGSALRAAAPANAPGRARAVAAGLAAGGLGLPTDPTGVAVDHTSGRRLAVIPREQWGADESIRFEPDGRESWSEMFVPPRLLVVHHTATRNDYGSAEEAEAEIRAIYASHTLGNGWGDIGYQAAIDRFGNIYEGRHGRGGDPGDPHPRETLSGAVTGGHTTLHEYGTAGVALLGDSTLEDWPMTAPDGPMWDALVRYCVFEAGRSALRPLAPGAEEAGAPMLIDFLQSDDEWRDGVPVIGPHRGLQETLCPGDLVIDLLPALRQAIHQSAPDGTGMGVTMVGVVPGGRELVPGTRVTVEWLAEAPADGWQLAGYEYAIEAWFKGADTEDLVYLDGYTLEPQPTVAWIAVGPEVTALSFVAERPGQYTVHVRGLLRRGAQESRTAYQASRTILVRDPVR